MDTILSLFDPFFESCEDFCDRYFVRRAPFQVPSEGKEVIVMLSYPLAFLVLFYLGYSIYSSAKNLLAFLFERNFLSRIFSGRIYYDEFLNSNLLVSVLSLLVGILAIRVIYKALPLLKRRSIQGWRYATRGSLAIVLLDLFAFFPLDTTLEAKVFSALVLGTVTAVCLYLWFQVKNSFF